MCVSTVCLPFSSAQTNTGWHFLGACPTMPVLDTLHICEYTRLGMGASIYVPLSLTYMSTYSLCVFACRMIDGGSCYNNTIAVLNAPALTFVSRLKQAASLPCIYKSWVRHGGGGGGGDDGGDGGDDEGGW
eukprot:GHVU01207641.1.p1 GENE.GHVU01207641.1~~GHVU01207641.1.p1  ORF type:complete len:131 (+),score=4.93 GHVU01207641.1:177-569(+)